MSYLIEPSHYKPLLNAAETEQGIKVIKEFFADTLSTALRSDAFPRAEVDYATAVAYLRKEAVTLPPDTPRGLVVIACRGHALGFAKNLGGRANNLYPQEWKIKSSHLPDTPVDVLAALAAPTCRPHAD